MIEPNFSFLYSMSDSAFDSLLGMQTEVHPSELLKFSVNRASASEYAFLKALSMESDSFITDTKSSCEVING